MVGQPNDWAQGALGDCWLPSGLGHGEDAVLDGRGEVEKGHDLADSGAGEALAAGDGGLVFNLAGVELALPFLGLAQVLGGMS